MKPLLLALLAVSCATPASARSLGERIADLPSEEKLYLALHAADFALTYSCLARNTCRELNPLVGKHPSKAKLIGFAVGTGVLHAATVSLIQDRDPRFARTFSRISLGLKSGVMGLHLVREF